MTVKYRKCCEKYWIHECKRIAHSGFYREVLHSLIATGRKDLVWCLRWSGCSESLVPHASVLDHELMEELGGIFQNVLQFPDPVQFIVNVYSQVFVVLYYVHIDSIGKWDFIFPVYHQKQQWFLLPPHPCQWLGYSNKLFSSLGSLSLWKDALNLFVIFNSESQLDKVIQSWFAKVRQLPRIKSFLTLSDREKVNHSFVYSRLHHCNSSFSVTSKAAETGIGCREVYRDTTWFKMLLSVLETLQWLPVSFRIHFRMLVL